MAELKITQDDGEVVRRIVSAQGDDGRIVHKRAMTQRMDPVMEHVGRMAEANKASRTWRYAGSIPITMLMSWLETNNVRYDQWARNENGEKQRFMRWFIDRDRSKLYVSGTAESLLK